MSEKRYKMIAIDLDGTLLSPTSEVTPRTKTAVHACLSAGMLVCFATGRNWTESRTILDAVAHFDTAVFVGGAMVVDTQHRVTLHRTLVDGQLARELCAFLEARGQAALALQDTPGVDYLVTEDVELNEATSGWMKVTHACVRRVHRLGEYEHTHTIRVGMVAHPQKVAELMAELNQTFAGRINVHAVYVPAYGVEVLEIFDPAVNKWEGILHVARMHKIDPGQIIAIGDDVNDLPMLRQAGLGVAMGNAHPRAKQAAKMVIGSNADEGLARFLEELVARHSVEPLNA